MDVMEVVYLSVVSVRLDPGNGYAPNDFSFIADHLAKHGYSIGSKVLPGYGETADLFMEKSGLKACFEDILDAMKVFHLPVNV